jgi:hypothetical protein
MIHDWLLSGELFQPYEFAKRNYVQFPAFHLPYHPPVYPGLLALFFVATGVSSEAARIFIALCMWITGCFFYGILKDRSAMGRCLLVLTASADLARDRAMVERYHVGDPRARVHPRRIVLLSGLAEDRSKTGVFLSLLFCRGRLSVPISDGWSSPGVAFVDYNSG